MADYTVSFTQETTSYTVSFTQAARGPQGDTGPPGTTEWDGITDKPATFPPTIGSGADEAVAGNDARLTDARTPTAHTHPATDISDSTAAGRAILTAADAAAQRTAMGLGTLATQSGTFSGASSGNNTGDQTITLTGDVTGSGTGSFTATLATVNANVGSFGSATQSPIFTVDSKGRITAASAATITPNVNSITGLGSGIANFLALPSSAGLAAAITDENGSGKLIFSAGTLNIASGKTATINNTITWTGTDGTTITLPTTNATMARTDAGQTFAGANSFSGQMELSASQEALNDTSAMNRLLVRQNPCPFYRPLEPTLRVRSDYFMRGSTTSGDIGEWGWASSLSGSASLGFGGGNNTSSPSGRVQILFTGTTSGSLAKLILSQGQTDIWHNITSTFHFATSWSSSSDSLLSNGAAWVGYSDQNLDTGTQYLLFGWDTAMSSNYLIRHRNGGSETVIDTGVALTTGGSFDETQISATIVGANIDSIGPRVIVTTGIDGGSSRSTFTTAIPSTNIFNHRYLVSVRNNSAAMKYLGVSGLEVRHYSPNYTH